MTTATADRPQVAAPAPRGRPRPDAWLPHGREWLIALLMFLLPVERGLVLQAGTVTVRPVFAVMAIIIAREIALKDWPWVVSRPAQQLMRGVLLGLSGLAAAVATGVWPNQNIGYVLWLAFSALFLMAMVRTITIRADLHRWTRWAVSGATFWSWIAVGQ